MRAMSPFTMRPIGWVRSPVRQPLDDCWAGVESRIELDEAQFTAESLRGLDEFSHRAARCTKRNGRAS
jgi:tRNA (Thr-GGU) A37 N-methylase